MFSCKNIGDKVRNAAPRRTIFTLSGQPEHLLHPSHINLICATALEKGVLPCTEPDCHMSRHGSNSMGETLLDLMERNLKSCDGTYAEEVEWDD